MYTSIRGMCRMLAMDCREFKRLSRVKIEWMAGQLRRSDRRSRKNFAEALFYGMEDEERKWWFNLFAGHACPKERWRKIRIWMERRYIKNYHWTPRRMATTYLNYSRMDSRMMPLLIKTARQVKNKIRMQRRREEERALYAEDE